MSKGVWEKVYEYEGGIHDFTACDGDHAWLISKGSVLAWNGSGWEEQFEPKDTPDSSESAVSIEVLDPQHVWVTASCWRLRETPEAGQDKSYFYSLYFYDGSTWSRQQEFAQAGYGLELQALDPRHVWAWDDTSIYFYDGQSWSEQLKTEGRVTMLQAESASLAFAVAATQKRVNYSEERSDGGFWSISAIMETSRVYRYDGSTWQDLGELDCTIGSMDVVNDSHAWAVGSRERYGPDEKGQEGAIFFWDGSSWEEQFAMDKPFVSVQAWSPDLAWATCRDRLYMYDGSDWALQFEGEAVSDLRIADDQNAWLLVSDGWSPGRLLFYDGSGWRDGGETGYAYVDICVVDAAHVWATAIRSEQAGCGTQIRFFNGSGWSGQADTGQVTLKASGLERIWAYSPYAVYTAVHLP